MKLDESLHWCFRHRCYSITQRLSSLPEQSLKMESDGACEAQIESVRTGIHRYISSYKFG